MDCKEYIKFTAGRWRISESEKSRWKYIITLCYSVCRCFGQIHHPTIFIVLFLLSAVRCHSLAAGSGLDGIALAKKHKDRHSYMLNLFPKQTSCRNAGRFVVRKKGKRL